MRVRATSEQRRGASRGGRFGLSGLVTVFLGRACLSYSLRGGATGGPVSEPPRSGAKEATVSVGVVREQRVVAVGTLGSGVRECAE